jgi:hypothetical protein
MSDNNLNDDYKTSEWMKQEASRIMTLPDGREVGATMTNWHWEALDWITGTVKHPLYRIIDTIEAEVEMDASFDEKLMTYIHLFIDRWDERRSPK